MAARGAHLHSPEWLGTRQPRPSSRAAGSRRGGQQIHAQVQKGACTTRFPYPFAAQVRLQPQDVYIPLPICGYNRSMRASLSPHPSACSKVPHDDRRNPVVGGDIMQIKHLRGLRPICEVFAEMLQKIIMLRELRPEDSFEELGLKAESNRGFDVNRKNQQIDYGNQEYPVLLWTMAMCCGEVARCLEVLSRRWPSLQSRCNTAYGIVRQADLIEILMSTTRGLPTAMFADQLETLRGESLHKKRHQELCYLMHTVHLLQARLTNGYLKHKKETIHRCVHHGCVHPSPPAHHRCGYNRSTCTSLSPYPFASQGRLQPKYVYIPLPTSRCSTGAVTTALCVHPSPHACPFAAQVGTILGVRRGRTCGSLGRWRCVCPRPSGHRVLGILPLRRRLKEQ